MNRARKGVPMTPSASRCRRARIGACHRQFSCTKTSSSHCERPRHLLRVGQRRGRLAIRDAMLGAEERQRLVPADLGDVVDEVRPHLAQKFLRVVVDGGMRRCAPAPRPWRACDCKSPRTRRRESRARRRVDSAARSRPRRWRSEWISRRHHAANANVRSRPLISPIMARLQGVGMFSLAPASTIAPHITSISVWRRFSTS